MENQNVNYSEAKENLNECNLKELQLEAERFGLSTLKLNKDQLIEKIIQESIIMGKLNKSLF